MDGGPRGNGFVLRQYLVTHLYEPAEPGAASKWDADADSPADRLAWLICAPPAQLATVSAAPHVTATSRRMAVASHGRRIHSHHSFLFFAGKARDPLAIFACLGAARAQQRANRGRELICRE